MRKRNLTQHHKNIVRFKLGEKIEKPGKRDDFHILYSNDKNNSKLDGNHIFEEKRNYTIEEKEQENIYESKEGENEDKKKEDDGEEYFNQPLLMVHRMSMKKKELGKIRSNLKKANIKKPETLEPIAINKEKAKQMAQNFFKRKLKYFNQIKNNTETENNLSDNFNSQPKRHFKNISSNNTLEIKTDYSQDKSNNIIKRKIENQQIFGNKLRKKRFERLPTDILQYKDIKINIEPIEEKKEEKNKEKGEIKKEIKEKGEEEEAKIEKEKLPQKEEENNIKEEKIEAPKILKEEEHKEKVFKRKFRLRLDNINSNIKNNRNNDNLKQNKTNPSIIESTKLNLTDRDLSGSRNKNNFMRNTLNANINKGIHTQTEKNEEKGNLTFRGFRRKFGKKNDEADSKIEYKAIIKVNKRIIDNKENNKNEEKESVENKYKKFKELKEQNKIKTEDNIRTRYGKKDLKIDDEKNLKIVKNEIPKENIINKIGSKVSKRNFYKRRLIKNT